MQAIKTNAGHNLTFREAKFIEYLVAGKAEREAYLMAGYTNKDESRMIKTLLGKKYIQDELNYRYQQLKDANLADANEVMQYYTDVMRGQIKDQFGLEAPLAERTKAANELAKRLIDYAHEAEMKDNESQEINITLNWSREEEKDGKSVEGKASISK